ncbi:MAG: tyrosine-type recombinase/integrase [Planctomycetes bacterium]|nr:tyrosine-type recombinase/integrase [Planctomycetota bacterium]
MASLRKREGIFHLLWRQDGKQLSKSLKTTSRKVAERELLRIEAKLLDKEYRVQGEVALKPLMERYEEHIRTYRTKKGLKSDLGRLTNFIEATGVLTLNAITAPLVQQYLDRRITVDGIKPKTVNNIRGAIQHLFSFAIQEGHWLGENPMTKVKRARLSAPSISYLTLVRVHEVLGAFKPWPDFQTAVAILIYTGLRRSELIWLTGEDVDLERGLILVRAKTVDGKFWEPKTKRNRSVPISKALRTYLEDYESPTNAPWFITTPRGCRWDPDHFSQQLAVRMKQVGLSWDCLEFRHTFGSLLAQKGVSLYQISSLMGNSPEICRRHLMFH